MIFVYMLTFSNTKRYIGLTSNIRRRLQAHSSRARTNGSNLINRAINKYKNFNVKIMGHFASIEEARRFERQLIQDFETIKFGYNMTPGGEGILGFKHSKETKLKIGAASKARSRSNEECAKLSQTRLACNILMSHASKLKMVRTKKAKPFKSISPDGTINFWELQSDCARELKLQVSHINSCLHKKRSHHKGHTFEYV